MIASIAYAWVWLTRLLFLPIGLLCFGAWLLSHKKTEPNVEKLGVMGYTLLGLSVVSFFVWERIYEF